MDTNINMLMQKLGIIPNDNNIRPPSLPIHRDTSKTETLYHTTLGINPTATHTDDMASKSDNPQPLHSFQHYHDTKTLMEVEGFDNLKPDDF